MRKFNWDSHQSMRVLLSVYLVHWFSDGNICQIEWWILKNLIWKWNRFSEVVHVFAYQLFCHSIGICKAQILVTIIFWCVKCTPSEIQQIHGNLTPILGRIFRIAIQFITHCPMQHQFWALYWQAGKKSVSMR